jgi:hypothetical protein
MHAKRGKRFSIAGSKLKRFATPITFTLDSTPLTDVVYLATVSARFHLCSLDLRHRTPAERPLPHLRHKHSTLSTETLVFFFFFFLNQFVFRNTSQRLGPVCIYEPIQFMKESDYEVPTRRVKEAETSEAWRESDT